MRRSRLIVCMLILAGSMACISEPKGGDCPLGTQECLEMLYAGYVKTPWLGIELDESIRDRAQIKRVIPGSPAEKAGIEAGDIILTMNNVTFIDIFKKGEDPVFKIGEDTVIGIVRKSDKLELTAQLISMPRESIAQFIGSHMIEKHLP